jgi:hypothetical protein
MTMQQAAQRMAPIDATRRRAARLSQVVLPQFIGEKERHDQQRQHEKCAQNHSLDHDEPPAPENVKSILCACRAPRAAACEPGVVSRALAGTAGFAASS